MIPKKLASREPRERVGSKKNGAYVITTEFRIPIEIIQDVAALSRMRVCTQKEIADMFGISVPTVSKIQRITNAIRRLEE